MAKGQKTCPDCSAIVGCRTHKCKSCGYVFMSKHLRTTEIDETKPDVALTRKTRRASWSGDKISIDKLRACCLSLRVEEKGNIVSLINPVILTKDFSPNLIFNSLPSLIEADIQSKTVSVWECMVASGSPTRVFTGALE